MGRVAKWRTILGVFDIKYMPRTAIKGQVLADLVAEFTEYLAMVGTEEEEFKGVQVLTISIHENPTWKLYVDGAANQRGSRVGIVIMSLEGITIEKSLRLGFSATNNEAKYEALLTGTTMVRKLGGKAVEIFSNLRLVIEQVKGELESRDHRIHENLNEARQLQSGFKFFSIQQVSRSNNTHVDSLATLATSSNQGLLWVILTEDQLMPVEVELVRGLDIVGPFPKVVGNQRWLLVDTDYFTKWVEIEPLSNKKDVDAKKFVWKNILTRFRIPHTLISDNGLQFDSKAFERYYGELGIKNMYSTPTYSQGNGQAEAVNKVIVNGMKNRLDKAKVRWVDELPHIL
ncbi:uncharacterized protein LOC142639627 [Castanea sativa]|uniref:uncharacterized protein LOC142639627 n=1 Tax=Castanea sativa TaxID=21020 RepID=UPI003F653DDD